MFTRWEPRRELSNTYFVQERSDEELHRIMMQDQLLTTGMGGVLPEQPDTMAFHNVLDVSCGTGGWLIEVARTYPTVTTLIGIDISTKIVECARAQAAVQGASDRVEFLVMDVLRMLEFPDNFFDLVNLRCGGSYLRTWDWPKLLNEFQRVCQPGGVVRVTEGDVVRSNSPALTHLSELLMQAFYSAGHYFTQDFCGLTDQLVGLLQRRGLQNVQTWTHKLEYHAGTPEGQTFYEDMRRVYRTLLPFLRKWTRVPDDYESIYEQALDEMQQPDFVATWHLLTVWGNAPEEYL